MQKPVATSSFRNYFPFILCALLLALVGCTGKKVIRSSGLSYIKLGEEMPPAGIQKWKKFTVNDSIFKEDEYQWRSSILDYRKGKVYLEEDFFSTEVLNRIRIETPELRLRNGLRVGNTVADLVASTPNWYIVPMKRFQMYDFYSELYPRIHFVIKDPSVPMDSEDYEDYIVQNFNPEAPVRAIVLY